MIRVWRARGGRPGPHGGASERVIVSRRSAVGDLRRRLRGPLMNNARVDQNLSGRRAPTPRRGMLEMEIYGAGGAQGPQPIYPRLAAFGVDAGQTVNAGTPPRPRRDLGAGPDARRDQPAPRDPSGEGRGDPAADRRRDLRDPREDPGSPWIGSWTSSAASPASEPPAPGPEPRPPADLPADLTSRSTRGSAGGLLPLIARIVGRPGRSALAFRARLRNNRRRIGRPPGGPGSSGLASSTGGRAGGGVLRPAPRCPQP